MRVWAGTASQKCLVGYGWVGSALLASMPLITCLCAGNDRPVKSVLASLLFELEAGCGNTLRQSPHVAASAPLTPSHFIMEMQTYTAHAVGTVLNSVSTSLFLKHTKRDTCLPDPLQ